MSTQPKNYLTPEQYLEIERKAEYKSEYYQGEMFAMSGASLAHNRIVTAAITDLGQQLRRGPCEVLGSDMRVAVTASDLYTYPDIVVVCGGPQLLNGQLDTLLNPTLIVEVLSPSTEAYDRGRKFGHYRTIESLKEYLMVSSELIGAELFRRQADGRWTLMTEAKRPEDTIELESVGGLLKLADLYEKVEFGERRPGSRLLPGSSD